MPANATPNIQPRSGGIGEGGGRTLVILTSRDLHRSASAVGSEKETTTTQRLWRSRDLLILAMKLAKASGAKGEMD